MTVALPKPIERGDVPREDWDRAPWNRWSFQHLREILPSAEVWRGTGAVATLPYHQQTLTDIRFKSARGEISIADFLDHSYTDGFIVLHHGNVVFERYMNGMDERTRHLSQSVAKSFLGALYGIMVAAKAVDPQKLVTHYLPELKATAYDGALVQHVLDMGSGVAYDEEYTDPYSDVGRTDVASGWKPKPAGDTRDWPTSMWRQVLTLKTKEAEHGARFLYRSIETDVLAFVLERVSGLRLPELLSREIWQKLGMEENGYYTIDPEGYALADGGLNACLRDYARFGQMIAQDGFFNGRQIVPAAWIGETRRGNHALFGPDYRATIPKGAYHNQFWIEDHERPVLECHGVFGQWIYTDPVHDFVLVKLSSWPDFLDDARFLEANAAAHAIKRALCHG